MWSNCVLRLPPYHCKFNPIELVWAHKSKVKWRVKDTTFKLRDVQILLQGAIARDGVEERRKCIAHAIKEEQKMWDLDVHVDVLVEPLIITPGNYSSDSDTSSASNN